MRSPRAKTLSMPRELIFLHRLALALGRTVQELRHTMTWRELINWQRFDNLHPLPSTLADIHHGMLMSAIANVTRGADSQPALASDFYVLRERVSEPEVIEPGLTEAERLQRIWTGGG